MDYVKIGELIVLYRKKLNISQKELAKEIGCSSPTLQRYETGQRKIRIETIEKIASIFNINPSYLVGWNLLNTNEELSYKNLIKYCPTDELINELGRRWLNGKRKII